MNTSFKPKIWVPGDWNAFFGFGTNILVNLIEKPVKFLGTAPSAKAPA